MLSTMVSCCCWRVYSSQCKASSLPVCTKATRVWTKYLKLPSGLSKNQLSPLYCSIHTHTHITCWAFLVTQRQRWAADLQARLLVIIINSHHLACCQGESAVGGRGAADSRRKHTDQSLGPDTPPLVGVSPHPLWNGVEAAASVRISRKRSPTDKQMTQLWLRRIRHQMTLMNLAIQVPPFQLFPVIGAVSLRSWALTLAQSREASITPGAMSRVAMTRIAGLLHARVELPVKQKTQGIKSILRQIDVMLKKTWQLPSTKWPQEGLSSRRLSMGGFRPQTELQLTVGSL